MDDRKQAPIGEALSVIDEAIARIASDEHVIANLRKAFAERGRINDELVAALKIVARWPFSQPDTNQDAVNMAVIAINALAKAEP